MGQIQDGTKTVQKSTPSAAEVIHGEIRATRRTVVETKNDTQTILGILSPEASPLLEAVERIEGKIDALIAVVARIVRVQENGGISGR